MTDDDGKHKVVLACALRCCKVCREEIPATREEALDLECEECSPDGKRYWEFGIYDPDPLKSFGKWLIHRRHRGFSVIAHNLKG